MQIVQSILGSMRRAVEHYSMIQENDTIAVGLSGGKDSVALLATLCRLASFYPIPFHVCAITVLPGFPSQRREDLAPFSSLCEQLHVPYTIVETQIAQIVWEERREKAPCSLCAKLRRGALCTAAAEMGANVLALGHHRDDVVETFMLNLMQNGHIGCFMPVTTYENTGMRVIRPLIYTGESEIRSLVKKEAYPVYQNPCPVDGTTKRAEIEAYLHAYSGKRNELYRKILGALERAGIDGWYS